MTSLLQLKLAYAQGVELALKTAGYDDQTARHLGIKLAEEAEAQGMNPAVAAQEMNPEDESQGINPAGVRLMGPNPGEPIQPGQDEQPDVNSLVEDYGEGAPVSPEMYGQQPQEMYGQESSPEAYAGAPNEDIYGALSE